MRISSVFQWAILALCLFLSSMSFSLASSEESNTNAAAGIGDEKTFLKKKSYFHHSYKKPPMPHVPIYKFKPHPIPIYKPKPVHVPVSVPIYKPVIKPTPISVPIYKPHPIYKKKHPWYSHPIFNKPPYFSHPPMKP